MKPQELNNDELKNVDGGLSVRPAENPGGTSSPENPDTATSYSGTSEPDPMQDAMPTGTTVTYYPQG